MAFLNYIYKQGQQLAGSVDYAPLPKALLKKATAQVQQASPSRRRDLGRVVHGTGGPPPVPCPRP